MASRDTGGGFVVGKPEVAADPRRRTTPPAGKGGRGRRNYYSKGYLMPDSTIPANEEIVVRPFADWLREQSKGKTHEELSDALYDLIQRVRDTGKKGSVELTVTVAPLKDDVDVLVVSDQIKLRIPEHDRKPSLFYPDKHGNLSRTDPQQLTFEGLREVPANVDPTTGEIKEIQA